MSNPSKAASTPHGGDKDQFIEILRGISIFLVAYYHFANRVPYTVLNASAPPLLPFYSGKIGVYIFFGISGYLIAQSLESSKSLADFYAKRVSRIWPLFIFACVFIYAFLQFFDPPVVLTGPKQFYEDHVSFVDLIGNIFFLEDLGFNWVDGVFWSILAELKYYLLIGLFAAAFKQNCVRFFSIFAAVMAILDFGISIFGGGHLGVVNKALHGLLISQYLPFFALGMALYARQLNGVFVANLLLATAQLIYATGFNPDFEVPGTVKFLAVFGAVLFFDSFLLKSRIMLFFGKYSYSIYLFHQMIGLTIISMLARQLGYDLAMVIAAAVIIVISVVASWLFEWRFRRRVAGALITAMGYLRLTRVNVASPRTETPVAATAS